MWLLMPPFLPTPFRLVCGSCDVVVRKQLVVYADVRSRKTGAKETVRAAFSGCVERTLGLKINVFYVTLLWCHVTPSSPLPRPSQISHTHKQASKWLVVWYLHGEILRLWFVWT